ncbi:MAG TPA: helix-turn-helix domain-containing protein [Chitinophagaceae bacterium]|nr:helix-turn-helix domain-containing protein [Chitinophagaceae bacterium]
MPAATSQEFLFRRVKELLPPQVSLVDKIASILHLSSDSAYRRIRGETPLVLEEARELCDYFNLSLDQILHVSGGSTLFESVRVSEKGYNYRAFLQDLLNEVRRVTNFMQREIIYRTKDMPVFHNFYFEPLIAFRYFFWMKTIIQDPAFRDSEFSPDCVPADIVETSLEISRVYNTLPSTEIWNTECINAAISQVEFYKDSGMFSSAKEIRLVYEALEHTVEHIRTMAEFGTKFMPGENPETRKDNFRLFYNRVVLGDNTVMVITDRAKTVFLNYDGLNYLFTRDATFCDPCYDDLQNLMKRSTLISQTSEKQRNIFFGVMLSKIADRKKHL